MMSRLSAPPTLQPRAAQPVAPPTQTTESAPPTTAATQPATVAQRVSQALVLSHSVFFASADPVTFASGIRSPVYMDVRQLLASPQYWRGVVECLADSLPEDTEVLAGVAMGGVPYSSAVAYAKNLPSCFVRSQTKTHGRGKDVEGVEVKGRKVVLVEDVVTTGGSSLKAATALREAGAEILGCVAVAGYGFHQKTVDLPLTLLASFLDVLSAAEQSERYPITEIEITRNWYRDPENWQP